MIGDGDVEPAVFIEVCKREVRRVFAGGKRGPC
jgi:hypothetical protein